MEWNVLWPYLSDDGVWNKNTLNFINRNKNDGTLQQSNICSCFNSGVHMKDLILLNTALPDRVEGGLINFRKMAQLSITFTELMKLQNSMPPVEPNMDLVNTLRVTD